MYLAADTCSEVHVALSPETQGLTIQADRLCGRSILVRSNHGHFCSGSVRVKPLPPNRWPNPHDFRARRIGRLDVLWKESCRFLELGGESEPLALLCAHSFL